MSARSFPLFASHILLLTAISAAETITSATCNDNRVPAGTLTNGVLSVHLEARQAPFHPQARPTRGHRTAHHSRRDQSVLFPR